MLPAERRRLVSVGAGLGSFTLIDVLRIAGVDSNDIATVGPHSSPIAQYEASLDNSGIAPDQRLRSESCSTLDNPWGFPGYAIREASRSKRPWPMLRVLGEPWLAEYYTPTRGDVVASVHKEAARIDWGSMLRIGMVERIRWTPFGYRVNYIDELERTRTILADHLHLAVGPGPLQIPPDSQSARSHSGFDSRITHVYEPHHHILRAAAVRPIVVAVRGGGISASHAVDLLLAARQRDRLPISVVQLLRRKERQATQAFNVPKAAWGGQLHQDLSRAEGEEAERLLDAFASTTTPRRRAVLRRRNRSLRDGSLTEIYFPDPYITNRGDRLRIDVGDEREPISADFVIDATGFVSGLRGQPIVDEFLQSADCRPSPRGRVHVEHNFAAVNADCAVGRTYVSGSLAFGRRYGAPDTFLGLQYAAHHIAADLARQKLGQPYTAWSSARWWTRWARGRKP